MKYFLQTFLSVLGSGTACAKPHDRVVERGVCIAFQLLQYSSVNKFVLVFFSLTSPPSLWDGVGVADSLFPQAEYWCWYRNVEDTETA